MLHDRLRDHAAIHTSASRSCYCLLNRSHETNEVDASLRETGLTIPHEAEDEMPLPAYGRHLGRCPKCPTSSSISSAVVYPTSVRLLHVNTPRGIQSGRLPPPSYINTWEARRELLHSHLWASSLRLWVREATRNPSLPWKSLKDTNGYGVLMATYPNSEYFVAEWPGILRHPQRPLPTNVLHACCRAVAVHQGDISASEEDTLPDTFKFAVDRIIEPRIEWVFVQPTMSFPRL